MSITFGLPRWSGSLRSSGSPRHTYAHLCFFHFGCLRPETGKEFVLIASTLVGPQLSTTPLFRLCAGQRRLAGPRAAPTDPALMINMCDYTSWHISFILIS